MKNPLDVVGNNTMKMVGDTAKRGIDNFMSAFEKEYEIETVIANLNICSNPIKNEAHLQITLKRKVKN